MRGKVMQMKMLSTGLVKSYMQDRRATQNVTRTALLAYGRVRGQLRVVETGLRALGRPGLAASSKVVL